MLGYWDSELVVFARSIGTELWRKIVMTGSKMSPENEAALRNFERIVEVPTWRDVLDDLVENRSGLLFCVYFGLFAALMGAVIVILIAAS